LKQVLNAFLEHRIEVLQNRSRYRLDKIETRLEVLDGLLIAYLNLDEVIRIIRQEDEPKTCLMTQFKLSETQAEAILNLRLRALAKIEEFEIRKEHQQLASEKEELLALLASSEKQNRRIYNEIKQVKNRFGAPMPFGERRTQFAVAPVVDIEQALEQVEKEAITIICSVNGWIRSIKGHIATDYDVKYREGDEERFRFHAYNTDKLILMTDGGKSFTIPADKLPSGRSNGESIRLMVDIPPEQNIVTIFSYNPADKFLIASRQGYGFVIPSSELIASTKTGKQIMTSGDMLSCQKINGDMVACVGDNRKMLLFKVDEIAEISKGKGVILQKFKGGQLTDITTFDSQKGLFWTGRLTALTDYSEYQANRATQGRTVPRGFPKNNLFSG